MVAQRRTIRQMTASSTTWLLVACAIGFAVQSGFASLSDPDLPQHLATGEWILTHRAVPFTEPFAWTRAGAPYFAYSWLPQVTMYATMRIAGPLGLHLLSALAGAMVVLAAATAARALGAKPAAAVAYAVASGIVALDSTPFVRPQLFMHVLVPLAWTCVARVRHEDGVRARSLAALTALNAIAANVHITFPVMATPLVLLVLDDGALRSRKTWSACIAVIGGWLISPYALSWLDVFRLNFAPNAITMPPAATGELTPGFIISPVLGILISALPLIAMPTLRSARERFFFGLFWLVGLALFARVFKGLGPWWWSAAPLAVAALGALPRASSDAVRHTLAVCVVAFVAALAIPNVRLYRILAKHEGDVRHRTLPSLKAFAVEPIAIWLEKNVRPGARGRVLTVFNYGSYLEWRLPSFSESIDGRTIFPDSAALPDAIGERNRGVQYGPWRSADLAIAPVTYPVAALLDGAADWKRIGVAAPAVWAPTAPRAALWVRRTWWDSVALSSGIRSR